MVGIYNKIKNGLNWIKGKAAKYVAPIVSKLGDFADSDFVQGLAGIATPALDFAIPGLGTGISKGLDWVGKAGAISKGLMNDYNEQGDDFGVGDIIKNVATGKYAKYRRNVPDGIKFAKRPDDLHHRIQLKSLPAPEDESGNRTGSYVEELD
ncbi:hypothetical protein FACS189472_15320 [Alphaproteobacteria bacterium]|nr:hypothetical protein FACS189472_15320 [Alphaproteobacteria bacterium]